MPAATLPKPDGRYANATGNNFTSINLYKPLGEREKVDILVLTIVRLGRQYGLEVKRIEEDLLQSLADLLELDNGVRDLEYHMETYLGSAFANFADLEAGTVIMLSGTPERVMIGLFCRNPETSPQTAKGEVISQ